MDKEAQKKIEMKHYPHQYSEEEIREIVGEEVYSYQLDIYGNNVYLDEVKGGGYILRHTSTHFTTATPNIIPIPEEDIKAICKKLGYSKPLDRSKLREKIAEIIKQWVINNYPIGSQTFSDLAGQILDRVEGKK